VLAAEHVLFPKVVRWYCEGRLVIEGSRVHVSIERLPGDPVLFAPA